MKKHWSVDTKELEKSPEEFAIWRLEQRINFGIGEKLIKRSELILYWDKIDIDDFKREALSLAL